MYLTKFASRNHPRIPLSTVVYHFCFYFILFLVLLLCLAKYFLISCRNGQSLKIINKLSQTPVGRGGACSYLAWNFQGMYYWTGWYSGSWVLNRVMVWRPWQNYTSIQTFLECLPRGLNSPVPFASLLVGESLLTSLFTYFLISIRLNS